MKKILLLIGLAAFTGAGAVLKPHAAQTKSGRTTTAKKSPTPAKKSTASNKTSSSKTTATAAKKPSPKPATKKDDKSELDSALAIEDAEQKVVSLTKFLADFPKSDLRPRAIESLTAARVAAGDTKLAAGDRENGLKLTRMAIADAPVPYPEKLFNEVISKVPQTIFFRGERAVAIEIADAIEKNLTTAPQLISLAGFYLNTENASEAKRLAEAAIKLDEKSRDAYLTLGMAQRLNFDLEASAAAYEKAVEIDPESVTAKQNLAETKRALGKTDEALAIFNALLEKEPSDIRSQNGRILTLFDAGNRADAEAELTKTIEADPANFVLIGGAAYWYAAKGESAKAIDLAGKAIAAEPRYVWSHIALAKAYTADGRLGDAEQVLLKARKYGDFPTLDYEIALVRLAGGFYREAADELQKSFALREGNVVAKLGKRVERSGASFGELVADERRAGILEPLSPESGDRDSRLKALLELRMVLASATPDAIRASELADSFAAGTDKMRFHRQIFAANELLEKKVAPAKALELSRAAVSAVDDGLNVGNPAGPIMAGELYSARTTAIANDKYVITPDVPKATLSSIARGRIEEIAGWSLLQQGNNAEAATRFRRAVSILPEKSAWWRSSYWRLGNALEAEGKDKEALDAYVRNYTSADPDAMKYASIESVFKRVNESNEGLDKLIGENPAKPKQVETVSAASPEAKPGTTPETKPEEKKTETLIEKKDPPAVDNIYVPVAQPSVEPKATPTDTPQIRSVDENKKVVEEQVPEAKPSPAPTPASTKSDETRSAEAKPLPTPEAETNKPIGEKVAEAKPSPAQTPEDTRPTEEKRVEPTPSATPEQEPMKPAEEKAAGAKPTPKPTEETGSTAEERLPEVKPSPTLQEVEAKPVDDQKIVSATRSKTADTKSRPADDSALISKPSPKPLFEPVVIEVKNTRPPPKGDPQKSEAGKTPDTIARTETIGRPRVVEGKEISEETAPACSLSVSQETISLVGGSGSVGLLVGVDGGDIKAVKFVSGSPKDIEVIAEPEIAGVTGRALYVIKSLNTRVGDYSVTFTSPCGRKEVTVRVR